MSINEYDYDMLDIKYTNQKLKDYEQDILNYDYNYFKTYNREKYKLIQKRTKKIINIFGISFLNLRIYKNKETNINFCPTRDYIKIKKFKNYTDRAILFIKKQLGTSKRYIDIKDMIINCSISLMTISNINKNASINIEEPKQKITILENEKLYINMDDCYQYLISENNKVEKYCIRIFSFNTGKENISKNRNKLLNKKVAFMIIKPKQSVSQFDVYNFIYDNINKNYDIKINYFNDLNWKNPNIIVAGDGALWIREIARWLGAYYILDKFHAFNYLWKSFVKVRGKKKNDTNWNKYIDTSTNLATGKYELLINGLKNNGAKKIFNYFKNNEQGIINQNTKWNIGCHAESTVFHLVKSLKGNGAKIYNFNTFNNMLIARANYLNNRI